MPAPANLVHQTTTGTGSGNLTLASVNGKQTFATAFGTGVTTDVFDYYISNQSAAEYERGTGHMSDATTLVRDTIIESTNSNLAVSFSAGTKDVTNDIPALQQTRGPTAYTDNAIVRGDTSASGALTQNSGVTIDDTNNVNIPGGLTVTGATVLGSTLTVSGATTINNTLAAGNTTVNGTLGVSGNTTLLGTLTVSGASTLNGAVSVNNTLNVSGATTLLSTLTVSGQANFNAAQPSIVCADGAARLSNIRVYTTTGNVWSKPAGLSFIVVEVCGAGGGSAGANVGKTMGGGGGAGGYAQKKIAAASLGATENVVVGTGGSAGASGGTAGGAGGTSSFGTTSFLTGCGGGGGPTGGVGNSLGGSGGLSTSGDVNYQGGDGGPGFMVQLNSGAVVASVGMAGWGGNSYFAGGPAGGTVGTSGASRPGFAGHAFGTGAAGGVGSSAGSGASGAVGAGGIVIVWEYI